MSNDALWGSESTNSNCYSLTSDHEIGEKHFFESCLQISIRLRASERQAAPAVVVVAAVAAVVVAIVVVVAAVAAVAVDDAVVAVAIVVAAVVAVAIVVVAAAAQIRHFLVVGHKNNNLQHLVGSFKFDSDPNIFFKSNLFAKFLFFTEL